MSKAVLISIQPKWCDLIANGKKTIEVRKSRPKLETPFKVYIYCTIGNPKNPHELLEIHSPNGKIRKANGKVIGEFVCDNIIKFIYGRDGYGLEHEAAIIAKSCVPEKELYHYLQGRTPYGWHISDLKIYDRPKELSEFRAPCAEYERDNPRCGNCKYYYSESNEAIGFYDGCCCDGLKHLEKPPQSWCYVEESEENA